MLTQTLRHLEEDGLSSRMVFAEVPPHVEYQLTEMCSAVARWMASSNCSSPSMEPAARAITVGDNVPTSRTRAVRATPCGSLRLVARSSSNSMSTDERTGAPHRTSSHRDRSARYASDRTSLIAVGRVDIHHPPITSGPCRTGPGAPHPGLQSPRWSRRPGRRWAVGHAQGAVPPARAGPPADGERQAR